MQEALTSSLENIPKGLRTRFAPSPTGNLHLGHVASAMYVWGISDRVHASVLLRIEDHDRQRCRPEFMAAILEDLKWLGFWEDGYPLSVQSQHQERYEAALNKLAGQGLIYACSCSRKELASRLGLESPEGELRYDGHCRQRHLPWEGHALRVVFPAGTWSFNDLMLGVQQQYPSQEYGDLLLRDRHLNWTYNLCVVTDDGAENIDLIIRGRDLLESTGRQLQLGSMLALSAPRYLLHHPLILEESGRKLSKRYGSTSLRSLRERGLQADDVLGAAAFAMGLIDRERPLTRDALGDLFR